MPQHASAKKRIVTNERDRKRNRVVKSQVRRAVQELNATMGKPGAGEQVSRTHSVLDKASKKGVLHPRKVDRLKSRLARAAHKAASK